MKPKRTAVLVSIPLVLLAAMPALAQDASPRVTRIESGALRGVAAGDPAITVFRGIPYAAPPLGAMRFRPPAPVRAWQGVRPAASFGATCPQVLRPGDSTPMDEDCLTANVWTGSKSAKERRPVFVWIYGGGFNEGSGANPQFDGLGLAKKGVVVVTFNYRLGPLGFLATPELSRESGHQASGNYGLLDDIALLKWVKRNIAAFGGDPTRVTIAGQSAGAGSVQFLTMSPLARGLFQRSIGESQVRDPGDPELRYLNTSWRAKANAEEAGTAYMADRGAKSLSDLRAMSWQDLVRGTNISDSGVPTFNSSQPPLFRPVIDGWVVPGRYSQNLATGALSPVTYVAGNNLDESGAVPETAFATLRSQAPQMRAGMPTTNVTLSAWQAWAGKKFGAMAAEFLALYPASNDDEAALMNNAAARDNSRISTWLWGRKWSRRVKLPMYNYFWTHALPGQSKSMRGAFHGSEISYVFDSLDASGVQAAPEDRKIADIMSSYWANIARKGDPNGPGLPHWPAYDPARAQVMVVGDSFGPQPIADANKLSFWQRYFASQEQW